MKTETPGPCHILLLIQLIYGQTFTNTGAKFIQRHIFTCSHTNIFLITLLFQAAILSEISGKAEMWPAPAPNNPQNLNIGKSLSRIWLIESTCKVTDFSGKNILDENSLSKY